MSSWEEGHALPQHIYSLKEKLLDQYDSGSVLFVSVDGSCGQKSVALKNAIPEPLGKTTV